MSRVSPHAMSAMPPFQVRLSPICTRVCCEPGWHLDASWAQRLRDFDLWFVHSGRGLMTTESGEVPLRPGVCIWMRPGHRYEATHDPSAPLTVNCIHFELRRQRGLAPPFEIMHASDLSFVDASMRRIIALRAADSLTAQASAETLFGALLTELAREAAANLATPAAVGTELHHRQVIQQLAAQIRESSVQPRTIAALARTAGYSIDHFSRVFEKVTGQRPRDFIIEARLARACQLLGETSLTVSEIAEALSYRDVFFFSRQFRKKTGSTPTEFRQSLAAGRQHAGPMPD